MSVQTAQVPCVFGKWVQICEYRADRQSLIVQVSRGKAILAFATAAPTVLADSGNVPIGLVVFGPIPENESLFRLSRQLDGELVIQSWFAWMDIGADSYGVAAFGVAGYGQALTIPQGVAKLTDVWLWGGNGVGGGSSAPAAIGGGGGGGGEFARTGPLTVAPGDVWGINVGEIGDATFLVDPTGTIIAQANGGVTGQDGLAGGAGGAGGSGGIGLQTFSGGNGGNSDLLGNGGGGGGAAGNGGAGTNGAGPVPGAGGGLASVAIQTPNGVVANALITGKGANGSPGAATGNNATPSIYVAGGGGGAGTGGSQASPVPGGAIIAFFPQFNDAPVVTVLEAWGCLPECPLIAPGSTPGHSPSYFDVTLPKLSPDAVAALSDLNKRIQAAGPGEGD